jgi:hypothetical protein
MNEEQDQPEIQPFSDSIFILHSSSLPFFFGDLMLRAQSALSFLLVIGYHCVLVGLSTVESGSGLSEP